MIYTTKNKIALLIIDIDTLIESDIVTKISDIQSGQLEGHLTYTEALSNALLNFGESIRSPGLEVDFTANITSAVHWKQLGHFVLRSLNYGYEMGSHGQ